MTSSHNKHGFETAKKGKRSPSTKSIDVRESAALSDHLRLGFMISNSIDAEILTVNPFNSPHETGLF